MRKILIALLLGPAPLAAVAAEEFVALKTPRGVTQPYLLATAEGQKYETVAILFPGGEGQVGLTSSGPRRGGNFVVRSRSLFVKNGIAAAVVDTPSDRSGLTDAFRSSAEHAADIAAVITDLNTRLPDAKVFLVGTSRGTISAAYIAAAVGDRVKGVVLTSSLFNAARAGPGLSGFDYKSIKVPLLFVHHREDACRQTPYSTAQRLGADYPLISVSGGDPPKSDPCEAFSTHGYLGREEPVVAAISAWILGKPFPQDIR